ncbi:branched-chain amino acid ABC transporter permease [bacterium]|nr:MAG: branched-chain amino acid ABC transporter permease [bacterium]
MLELVRQYFVSAIVVASALAPTAAGISLIYGVMRYPNFALGEFMTVGGYLALVLSAALGMPLPLAALAAALAAGVISLAVDQTAFRAVRRAGILPPILLSLGLMLILQNVVRIIWGNGSWQLNVPLARPYQLWGFSVTPYQLISIVVSAVTLGAAYVVLMRTRFGKAVRALADNPDLALVSGVEPEPVYAGVTFMAGFLAAIGGVLLGLQSVLTPLMGWDSLLPAFAIAILGGLGNVMGAGIAALIIGLAGEYSLLFVQSSYKSAVAFVVLALILIVRPTGILGERP